MWHAEEDNLVIESRTHRTTMYCTQLRSCVTLRFLHAEMENVCEELDLIREFVAVAENDVLKTSL